MPEESSICSIAAVTRSTARRASGTASAAAPDSIMSAIAPATFRARSEYSPRPRYGCCRRSRRSPSINPLTSATPASAMYSSNRTWRRLRLCTGRGLSPVLRLSACWRPPPGRRNSSCRSAHSWPESARAQAHRDRAHRLADARHLVELLGTGDSQELTAALLRSDGPCPLDELNDIAYDVIEARYMLGGLTALQHDLPRRMIAADATIAMAALHVVGGLDSLSSTARPVPPCSPIWAGMRSAGSAAWLTQAIRCSRCG